MTANNMYVACVCVCVRVCVCACVCVYLYVCVCVCVWGGGGGGGLGECTNIWHNYVIGPEVITTVQHLQHCNQSNYVTQKKLHNVKLELNNRNVTKILQNPSFLNLALVYCETHNIYHYCIWKLHETQM